MTSIFNSHFWHHTWTRWSDPIKGETTYIWGATVGGLFQTRKCTVCGKVETRRIDD